MPQLANTEAVLRSADRLRMSIENLFRSGENDGAIILGPGILVTIRLALSAFSCTRLLLTNEEYLGPDHFSGFDVDIAPVGAMVETVREKPVDAVIASVVSWRGHRQPIEATFGRIRSEMGNRAPLLIVDYAHAGADGFPPIEDLNADLVCGDLEKWIAPHGESVPVSFLWTRRGPLQRACRDAFSPFFLATDNTAACLCRWVSPDAVQAVDARVSLLDRDQLLARHETNLAMASRLSRAVALDEAPETSILWLDEKTAQGKEIQRLEEAGLVWRLPGYGVRVSCRSDWPV